ncbi:MAG: hypothetical protein JW862_17925, partial [Anaerolineales bacterium]|nr:hypothetical protein [Anaerolineales bacterium]
PNPSELLSSGKMKQALAALAQRFDYVILDSPPTMVVTDAAILSQHADGVALVIDFDKTPRQHLKQAVEYLQEVKANLLGVIINRLSSRGDGYYYYYYYRKSYYHESDRAGRNGRGPLGQLGKWMPKELRQLLGLEDAHRKARRSGSTSSSGRRRTKVPPFEEDEQ